eukprot:11338453-Heterocapsa_arctica.AAC.1
MALPEQEEPRPEGVPRDCKFHGEWDPEEIHGGRAGEERGGSGGVRRAQRGQGHGHDERRDDGLDRGRHQRNIDDRIEEDRGEAWKHREHECGSQGDDRDHAQGHREGHRGGAQLQQQE